MTGAWVIDLLVGAVAVVVLGWLVLAGLLVVAYPGRASARELLRLLPDVLRLVRALLTDRRVPRAVRIELWLLIGYLALPVDLVPDFVPVLGYADDVVVALLVLRRAVRRTDVALVREHWSGRADALHAVLRIVRGRAAAR